MECSNHPMKYLLFFALAASALAQTAVPKLNRFNVVATGRAYTLDGSSSKAAVTYRWTTVEGEVNWTSSTNIAKPSFTVSTPMTAYVVRLTVSGRQNRTASADLRFTAVTVNERNIVTSVAAATSDAFAAALGPVTMAGADLFPWASATVISHHKIADTYTSVPVVWPVASKNGSDSLLSRGAFTYGNGAILTGDANTDFVTELGVGQTVRITGNGTSDVLVTCPTDHHFRIDDYIKFGRTGWAAFDSASANHGWVVTSTPSSTTFTINTQSQGLTLNGTVTGIPMTPSNMVEIEWDEGGGNYTGRLISYYAVLDATHIRVGSSQAGNWNWNSWYGPDIPATRSGLKYAKVKTSLVIYPWTVGGWPPSNWQWYEGPSGNYRLWAQTGDPARLAHARQFCQNQYDAMGGGYIPHFNMVMMAPASTHICAIDMGKTSWWDGMEYQAKYANADEGYNFPPAGKPYNPTAPWHTYGLDRSDSYRLNNSIGMARFHPDPAKRREWCGYTKNQITNLWLFNLTPIDGGAGAYWEAKTDTNLGFNTSPIQNRGMFGDDGWHYGTSPWRQVALPATFLVEAHTMLSEANGSCTDAALAGRVEAALVQIEYFLWNYGTAFDNDGHGVSFDLQGRGGLFYDILYAGRLGGVSQDLTISLTHNSNIITKTGGASDFVTMYSKGARFLTVSPASGRPFYPSFTPVDADHAIMGGPWNPYTGSSTAGSVTVAAWPADPNTKCLGSKTPYCDPMALKSDPRDYGIDAPFIASFLYDRYRNASPTKAIAYRDHAYYWYGRAFGGPDDGDNTGSAVSAPCSLTGTPCAAGRFTGTPLSSASTVSGNALNELMESCSTSPAGKACRAVGGSYPYPGSGSVTYPYVNGEPQLQNAMHYSKYVNMAWGAGRTPNAFAYLAQSAH
jgi:hypothetical protein